MRTSPLIQVDELPGLLARPEAGRPVVLDVRYRLGTSNGREEFQRAHIPGASYVDMDTQLATIRPDGMGGRHPMPTVETFSAAMRSAGVTMSRQVVAYDDWASLPASRVWWMLRHLGFVDVRVLDGGIAAWTAAGHPTESGPCAAGVGDFSAHIPGVGRLLDAADATTYAARHLLLDARAAARFRGENETIDAVAGHIPGATSAPALDNVEANGRFLPAEQLAGRFRELLAGQPTGRPAKVADTTQVAGPAEGADTTQVAGPAEVVGAIEVAGPAKGADTTQVAGPAEEPDTVDARSVGTYCGSGVQATHLALALSVAGVTDHADVYIGSWSDWITDPARPIAV